MSNLPEQNVPVQNLRHRRIKAAIWANQSPNGVFYTVTVARSYKKDEVWHDTQSFRFDDLPIVAKLLNDAHSVIVGLIENAKAASRNAQAPSTSQPRRRGKS